jgi:hypothetical protein
VPKARQAKPEKDQAATEIANEEETRAASVTDGEEGIARTDGIDGGEVVVPNPEGEAVELVSREEIEETAEALVTPTEEIEGEPIDLLDEALSELGEPDGSYPAPVVNAINLIRAAKAGLDAAGVEVVGTLEQAIDVELFSPGEVCPDSGLWRPVGSEAALSKGDRFPPPSIATGWMLMQSADQGDDR